TNPPTINAGHISNKGVEFMLSYNNRVGELKYDITGTMAFNKNLVVDIPNEEGIIHGPPSTLSQGTVEMFRAEEGFPIGYFWGYETDGIFQDTNEVNAYVNSAGEPIIRNVVPGDVNFVDVNGSGAISDSDKVMIGNPHPDFVFGLQVNLDYKGFYFQFTGNGMAGHQVAKSYRSFADSPRHNYTTDVYDRWHGPGTSDKYPRLYYGTHKNYQWVSDIYIEDADFFRISNITLGYDLNQLIKGIPFAQTRLYVAGNNVYTFTKYSGMDPEVGYSPTDDDDPENDFKWGSGIDLGLYPQPRTFMVGLSIKF
ncbi:SusC/RagA family protein, partial [Bacteroidota bacterium]